MGSDNDKWEHRDSVSRRKRVGSQQLKGIKKTHRSVKNANGNYRDESLTKKLQPNRA